MFDEHDKYFFTIFGLFFMVLARRLGRDLAEGIAEDTDPPQDTARWTSHGRWTFFLTGLACFAWGAWRFIWQL